MTGHFGAAWTAAHISDAVLVGPANMGSPSVYGAYANGPSACARHVFGGVNMAFRCPFHGVSGPSNGLFKAFLSC